MRGSFRSVALAAVMLTVSCAAVRRRLSLDARNWLNTAR
jgi:hypothetical protein